MFVSGKGWNDSEHLILTVEKGVTLRGPAEAVDGFTAIDDGGTEHATSGPGLDLTVLTRSRESTFIRPLNADDSTVVSFGDALLDTCLLYTSPSPRD